MKIHEFYEDRFPRCYVYAIYILYLGIYISQVYCRFFLFYLPSNNVFNLGLPVGGSISSLMHHMKQDVWFAFTQTHYVKKKKKKKSKNISNNCTVSRMVKSLMLK